MVIHDVFSAFIILCHSFTMFSINRDVEEEALMHFPETGASSQSSNRSLTCRSRAGTPHWFFIVFVVIFLMWNSYAALQYTRRLPYNQTEIPLKNIRSDATGRPKSSTGVETPVYRSRTRYQEQMWSPVVALWSDTCEETLPSSSSSLEPSQASSSRARFLPLPFLLFLLLPSFRSHFSW